MAARDYTNREVQSITFYDDRAAQLLIVQKGIVTDKRDILKQLWNWNIGGESKYRDCWISFCLPSNL